MNSRHDDGERLHQPGLRHLCLVSDGAGIAFDAANNSTHTAAYDGKFYYGGGHFQKYAVTLGLGGDDNSALAAGIKRYVGNDLAFTYSSPQLAAGIKTSASDYAPFLRKLLAGTLALSTARDAVGVHAAVGLPHRGLQPVAARVALRLRALDRGRAADGRRRVQQPGRVRLLSLGRRHAHVLWDPRALLAWRQRAPRSRPIADASCARPSSPARRSTGMF